MLRGESLIISKLVGGWTNPSEKYARQNGSFPPNRDEHSKKSLKPSPRKNILGNGIRCFLHQSTILERCFFHTCGGTVCVSLFFLKKHFEWFTCFFGVKNHYIINIFVRARFHLLALPSLSYLSEIPTKTCGVFEFPELIDGRVPPWSEEVRYLVAIPLEWPSIPSPGVDKTTSRVDFDTHGD